MTLNISIVSKGGRVANAQYRRASEICETYEGLEEGVNRYDLLLLVKRIGRFAGFSPRMIELLDYYMAYTRDIDWEEGSNPIVYQSQARTALDLGISERQVQRVEQDLFKAGALTWNDSGNHKRYGQRDPETGRILYAYGIDLTPLAYLKTNLEDKLQEKQLYDAQWMETKRKISAYRAQIRAGIAELTESEGQGAYQKAQSYQARYDEIAVRIRTQMDVQMLMDLLKAHQALCEIIMNEFKKEDTLIASKMSCTHAKNDAHKQITTYKKSNKLDTSRTTFKRFQKSSRENPAPDKKAEQQDQNLALKAGLDKISLKQILNICSDDIRDHLPIEPNQPLTWAGIVEAAFKMRSHLQISQNSWGDACITLGRTGAAICLILTDQATRREENAVRKPAAYFKAMLNRAKKGELKLHQSVFGLLKNMDWSS